MTNTTRPAAPRLLRRQFLTAGVGGLGLLSLPLLRSRSALAGASVPQRLLLVYSPNGTIQEQFWPTAGATESQFTLNQICAPLEAFKQRLLFLKGLNIEVAKFGTGGPHQKGIGGLFTNSELQAGSLFVDGDGQTSGWANGISIDQAVAQSLRQVTPLSSLELGVRAIDNDVRGRISYAGAGNPMTPMNSPLAAFERVFSSFGATTAAQQAHRSRVIDVVAAQYASLLPRLSRVDQIKVQQQLQLVRDVEQRMLLSRGRVCETPKAPPDLAEDNEKTMPDIADLHVDLLSAAFACDLTRVASLQISTAINGVGAPWLNSVRSGHELSHAGPTDASATEELIRRQRWVAEKIARLMTALDAISEAEGSVLDHTLIVWANELGEGSIHSHEDIPFLVAGGGGNFQMGRFLQLGMPGGTGGQSHGRLLTSIGNALGLEIERFGSTNVASEPLTL